jgi:isochorismate synthase EntC
MQEINYSIKNESNSLVIERDILIKSISRLYQQDPQLTRIQQDKLLTKYQYQLRVVNEKIKNLESKKEPDVLSSKDQSIKEMDQKLSRIEKRLQELTTKFTRPNEDVYKVNQKPKKVDSQILAKKNEDLNFYTSNMKIDSKSQKNLEVVTMTEVPKKIPEFFLTKFKEKQLETKIIQHSTDTPVVKNLENVVKIAVPKINVCERPECTNPKYTNRHCTLHSNSNQTKFENNETEVVIPSSQSVESQQTEIKHPITNENTKEQVKDVDESLDEDDISKVVASIEKSLSNLDQVEVE